ncbi:hypothetical protein QQS21_006285 [Conoideocrella luteorostrata]|uniref:L-ascorbate oxidase n=1 Tax=Conoideocrella luteorostrata TaxID=1105319 RepID=A0AAJ0FYD5_9HYPO|nr:hypothetical protein QQS21_006285 [Conoideocrella luteorostrata]
MVILYCLSDRQNKIADAFKVRIMLRSALSVCLAFLAFYETVWAGTLHVHNSTFQPDYVLRVTIEDVAIACRWRTTVVVNGTTPGPAITLYENQTTWIRVYNDMHKENLTMHWHGLTQAVAPFSDGTPIASQWPIAPKHFFDYEVHPDIGEAGTYFYHSHVGFQAVSAAGALIIEERHSEPPYSYDEERLVLLTELYNKTDDQIIHGITQPLSTYIWSGYPEAIMVNGKSFAALNATESGTQPPFSTPPANRPDPDCHPEVFHVKPGKTYRFRAIGGTALALILMGFEGHENLQVMAADGRYSELVSTDRIEVNSGQRFDFLLKTKSKEEIRRLGKKRFWVQLETRLQPLVTTSYAVLQYDDCGDVGKNQTKLSPPANPPLVLPSQPQDWLEYKLHPLRKGNFPPASEVARRVDITNALIGGNPPTLPAYWSPNNRTWTELNQTLFPKPDGSSIAHGSPYLVQVYQQGDAAIPNFEVAVANKGYDQDRNVYVAKVGEVIDIVLHNQPGTAGFYDAHPWHAHGGHIWDLGSGPGEYDPVENEKKLNGKEPMVRDTTTLYSYANGTTPPGPAYTNQGWRAWRLRVEYAGVWMIHCHTLQHMIMGMQTVWIMGNASEITKSPPSYVSGYLEYGGDAYGNRTHDPVVLHYFEPGRE